MVAMKVLHQQYPEDVDIASIYAESLMDMHPWDLWEKDGTARPWTPEIIKAIEVAIHLNRIIREGIIITSMPWKHRLILRRHCQVQRSLTMGWLPGQVIWFTCHHISISTQVIIISGH